MDSVDDLETIDVELDEFFTTKPTTRSVDEFVNNLSEEALEDCNIPEDFEGAQNADDEGSEDEEFTVSTSQCNTHNPQVKWNNMKPMLWEKYETPHQLKLCLTNYAISQGYPIKFKKCDSRRLVAVCASDPETFKCPYIVRASWMSTEKTFQIKTLEDQHTCVRNYRNTNLMDPTWIARQFLKEMMKQPNLKCKDMQAIIQSKFHCKVSWSKCYRAKCRALSLIDGRLSDHYAKVWDYGMELQRSNPRSTIKITVEESPDQTTSIFQRMYICFRGIKEGWKVGCRRVIGLDGSFLKGQCKGELLTAIGRDANNHVYPIAWAVVGIESKENWQWFLSWLSMDLELDGINDLFVISDQHKVLLFKFCPMLFLHFNVTCWCC